MQLNAVTGIGESWKFRCLKRNSPEFALLADYIQGPKSPIQVYSAKHHQAKEYFSPSKEHLIIGFENIFRYRIEGLKQSPPKAVLN